MGTNFYRVPTEAEMLERKKRLEERISKLEMSATLVANGFRVVETNGNPWENIDPWHEFEKEACIHLGKRSGGWKFLWNFNDNRFYTNKEELLDYIRNGRVVDEYGTEQNVEEFIEMALNWCAEDGLVFDEAYEKKQLEEDPNRHVWGPSHYDLEIDGLRVCRVTDFS